MDIFRAPMPSSVPRGTASTTSRDQQISASVRYSAPTWATVEPEMSLQQWMFTEEALARLGPANKKRIVPVSEPTSFNDVMALPWFREVTGGKRGGPDAASSFSKRARTASAAPSPTPSSISGIDDRSRPRGKTRGSGSPQKPYTGFPSSSSTPSSVPSTPTPSTSRLPPLSGFGYVSAQAGPSRLPAPPQARTGTMSLMDSTDDELQDAMLRELCEREGLDPEGDWHNRGAGHY